MSRSLFLLTAVLLLSFEIAIAKTLYVSKSGDVSNGLSWETGFKKVTEAIDSATAGDEIWVASGTYIEQLELKDGVNLYGGFDPARSP